MILALIIIIGLIIGSFLNVCIFRIPKGESISFPPSHCSKCKTNLKPWNLIPVLSYLLIKGRCRYCGEKISPQYPFIEIFNALIFLLLFIKFDLSLDFIAYSILSSLLLVISLIDFKTKTIPNGLVLFGLITGISYKICIFILYTNISVILNSTLGLLIGGGFLLLVAVITKGGMGGGDIKLMGTLGLWLGIKATILTMFISFLIGGVISAILLLFRKKRIGQAIPFGPFIAIAAFISIYHGQEIFAWYLKNILV